MDKHQIKSREKVIAKARKSDFKNAVFWINHYNHTTINIDTPAITPEDVLETYNINEFMDISRDVTKLLDDTWQIVSEGMPGYPGTSTHKEILDKLKCDYPGYDDECYQEVIFLNQIKLR